MKIQFDSEQLKVIEQQFGTSAGMQEAELKDINGGLNKSDIIRMTTMALGEEGTTYPKPGPIYTTLALNEEGGTPVYPVLF